MFQKHEVIKMKGICKFVLDMFLLCCPCLYFFLSILVVSICFYPCSEGAVTTHWDIDL